MQKAIRRGLRVRKTLDLTHFPNTRQQRNASRQQTVRRAVHVISLNKSNRPDNQIPETGLTKLGHNIHANFVVGQRSVNRQHASSDDAFTHTHTPKGQHFCDLWSCELFIRSWSLCSCQRTFCPWFSSQAVKLNNLKYTPKLDIHSCWVDKLPRTCGVGSSSCRV